MGSLSEFATFQSAVGGSLVSTTRTASQLAAEDLPFHRSLDARLASTLDAQNARLLGLAERLLGGATANSEIVRPALKDVDDVEGEWSRVTDVIDSLLEKADISLDEFTGVVKRLSPSREQVRRRRCWQDEICADTGEDTHAAAAEGLKDRSSTAVSRLGETPAPIPACAHQH